MRMDPTKTKSLRRSFSSTYQWNNLITGDHHGGIGWGPYVLEYGRTERSETVQNETDDTGWRKPSPYAVTSFEDVQYGGQAELRSKTRDGRDYQITKVVGDNLHWSALTAPRLIQPPLEYPSYLVDRTLNRALIKLKDSVVDYGVMLAEAKTTADMVAQSSRTMLKALRLAKRGHLKGAAGTLGLSPRYFKNTFNVKRGSKRFDREMSKRWLELQYGWRPLVSDIQGVLNDFEKGFIREPRIAVTKESRVTDKLYNTALHWVGNTAYWYGSEHTDVDFICRVRLDYVLETDQERLRQMISKGIVSPLPIIWESTPWTFVSDWLVPVGEFLQTLDASLGLTFKGGSWTVVTKARTLGQVSFQADDPLSTATGQATGYVTKFNMERNVYEHEPSGGLYFKNPFSASHAINALALLNQFTNPKRRRGKYASTKPNRR